MTLPYTLAPGAIPPRRAHPDDAGLDLATMEPVGIFPGGHMMIDTGVAVQIPQGHVGLVFVRSSLGIKKHLMLSNGTGVIDAGYTGTIKCSMYNAGRAYATINKGDYVAQLVIVPITTPTPVQVERLDDSARGTGGIGSTDGHH